MFLPAGDDEPSTTTVTECGADFSVTGASPDAALSPQDWRMSAAAIAEMDLAARIFRFCNGKNSIRTRHAPLPANVAALPASNSAVRQIDDLAALF